MEAPRLERKLVAILAADVEGYSRHMERDEATTLAPIAQARGGSRRRTRHVLQAHAK